MGILSCERRLFRGHVACIGALLVAHSLLHALRRLNADGSMTPLWPWFDLNGESNLPATFSALALLLAAYLLFSVASAVRRAGQPHHVPWLLLGAVFVVLAIDEAAGLHELLNRPVRGALHAGGIFYFAWVVPYAALLSLLLLALWRFMLDLAPDTRRWFVVAGAVYVGGALLLEMVGARIWDNGGAAGRSYCVVTTIEEVLEMLGIAIFVRALVAHRRRIRAA